jgi:hypothetical protein
MDEKQAPSEIDQVAQAIYDAPNGIDGDQIADMLIDDDRITGETAEECRGQVFAVCQHAAVPAISAHKAALVAAGHKITAREPTEKMAAATAYLLPDPKLAAMVWRAMWDEAE